MKDLTVIVPIHKYDDTIKVFFSKALESFFKCDAKNESKLVIVTDNDNFEKISTDFKENDRLSYLINTGNTDIQSQINFGAKNIKTRFFSVLEFDDLYSEIWFNNVERMINEGEDISLYLPLIEALDFKTKATVGYINEAVWASSFSDEIGYLDIESLKGYMDFNVTGGVFKTEDFNEVGGLKSSMKFGFWYEFLLRLLDKKKKVYVIPKVGYYHHINRPDSITDEYSKTINSDEAEWWIEQAQKQYLFTQEKKIEYKK